MLLALIYPGLLRMDGVDGSYSASFSYRWVPSGEDLFLQETANRNDPAAIGPEASAVALRTGDWPAFRGPDPRQPVARRAHRHRLERRAPRLLWKHRVGPGWSSFAVLGNNLYTQEQRGEDEAVVCYDAETGKEIWVHKDHARFY